MAEGLRPTACWDYGFESRWNHRCLSLVNVACYQIEFSASGRSPVQRNPIECAYYCVIYKRQWWSGLGPRWAVAREGKRMMLMLGALRFLDWKEIVIYGVRTEFLSACEQLLRNMPQCDFWEQSQVLDMICALEVYVSRHVRITWYLSSVVLHTALVSTAWPLLSWRRSGQKRYAYAKNIDSGGSTLPIATLSTLSHVIKPLRQSVKAGRLHIHFRNIFCIFLTTAHGI